MPGCRRDLRKSHQLVLVCVVNPPDRGPRADHGARGRAVRERLCADRLSFRWRSGGSCTVMPAVRLPVASRGLRPAGPGGDGLRDAGDHLRHHQLAGGRRACGRDVRPSFGGGHFRPGWPVWAIRDCWQNCRRHGLERAKRFSWEATAGGRWTPSSNCTSDRQRPATGAGYRRLCRPRAAGFRRAAAARCRHRVAQVVGKSAGRTGPAITMSSASPLRSGRSSGRRRRRSARAVA